MSRSASTGHTPARAGLCLPGNGFNVASAFAALRHAGHPRTMSRR